MIRFLAIFLGAGIVGVLVLIKLLGGSSEPAWEPAPINLAPKETQSDIFNQKRVVSDKIRQQIEDRFAGASQDILDLAAKIANPDVMLSTYSADIARLSTAEVNEGYEAIFSKIHPGYAHTLLREAVLAKNTGAAIQLLDRGADIHYNDDEIAFQSVAMLDATPGYELWFPNYSTGAKFLRMWLERDGEPNISHPLYGKGLGNLLAHTPKDNLEATIDLLNGGADPWTPFSVRAADGGVLYETPGYFASLVTRDRKDLEVSFRLAHEGFYKNGPSRYVDEIVALMEEESRITGPADTIEAQNTLWAMGRAYSLIYDEMGRVPGPYARNVISLRFNSGIGGFFLGEGEIRSPNVSTQRMINTETQSGRHQW